MSKPMIAAVNGYALGGGCELALRCDIRICSETAKFGLTEVKVGSIPGDGGTQRLPRTVGVTNAMYLLLTGDHADAEMALRIGLVSKIVPQAELLNEAMIIARKIAATPPSRFAPSSAWRPPACRHAEGRPGVRAPGLQHPVQFRGPHRGPQGLRREAQAQLRRPLIAKTPKEKEEQMSGISNQIAIAGVGYSRQGTLPGETPMSLLVEATKNALADAGITKDQIDGLYTMPGTTSPEGPMHYLAVGATLGIDPKVTGTYVMGGGSAGACVQAAAMAIHAGLATTVLCVMGETARSGGQRFSGASGGGDNWGLWGFFAACANSAVTASRHMALYGTTSEHLGNVAVANRLHASKNPDAIMRTPISIEDHQNSRWIVKPLHLLDCCLISDGAVAYVVTSAERAKDMKQKVVTIAGMGQGYTTRNLDREDWWYVPHQKEALGRAFSMAGVTPKVSTSLSSTTTSLSA